MTLPCLGAEIAMIKAERWAGLSVRWSVYVSCSLMDGSAGVRRSAAKPSIVESSVDFW